MHIRKYDFDYSRRYFMEKTAKGVLGTGVLSSLTPLIGNTGDISKAYPDELLSIDNYTKGKISTGDIVDENNVDIIKELLDPIMYMQVKQMGRRLRMVPTTTDITKMYPSKYLEASLRNQGKATLNKDGNLITKETGKPWIGGVPFMEPKTALEGFCNLALCWGRHDACVFPINSQTLNAEGELQYEYDFAWVEQNMNGLINDPEGRVDRKGNEDELRRQTAWFSYPNDSKGTAYLSTWYNDQRRLPDLYGYLPAFKRVRRFPASQRFEPLVPGMTFFLSDAWGSGDPYLTWGKNKIIARKPMLGAQSDNWYGDQPNWSKDHLLHGGPAGKSFFELPMELCPETYVFEAEPTGYPRAPISKKHVYSDARNHLYTGYITFDRRGELWRSFELAGSQMSQASTGLANLASDGTPEWSWSCVQSMDIQTGALTRFNHLNSVRGGVKSNFDTQTLDYAYDKYLTRQALQRMGT